MQKPPRIRIRHAGGEAVWSQGPVRVGRAPDNDLIIDDESLSRHHSEIRLGRSGWVLFDLESANGSWTDGIRKPQIRLYDGQLIVLGKVPVQIMEASAAKSPSRWIVLAVLVLLIGGAWSLASRSQDVLVVERPAPRVFEVRVPAPPEGLTAEKALEAARRFTESEDRSGASLAHGRRALQWARQLYGDEYPADAIALEAEVHDLLEERFRRGSAAYVRARRLGQTGQAQAAMRMLRETFPFDDPRSYDLDRLEEGP